MFAEYSIIPVISFDEDYIQQYYRQNLEDLYHFMKDRDDKTCILSKNQSNFNILINSNNEYEDYDKLELEELDEIETISKNEHVLPWLIPCQPEKGDVDDEHETEKESHLSYSNEDANLFNKLCEEINDVNLESTEQKKRTEIPDTSFQSNLSPPPVYFIDKSLSYSSCSSQSEEQVIVEDTDCEITEDTVNMDIDFIEKMKSINSNEKD